jgi:predicted CoA-binding protein
MSTGADADARPTIAVVGASRDRKKYGNKCVRAYRQAGWTVYPVNPASTEVEGLPTYASLDQVPAPLDRISVYLPPASTAKLLDALPIGPEVFFNPGSADDEILAAARRRGLAALAACSIVAIGLSPASFPD